MVIMCYIHYRTFQFGRAKKVYFHRGIVLQFQDPQGEITSAPPEGGVPPRKLTANDSHASLSPAFLHRVLVCVLPGDEDEMKIHTQSFHGFEKHMDTSAIAPCYRVCRHRRDYHYPIGCRPHVFFVESHSPASSE